MVLSHNIHTFLRNYKIVKTHCLLFILHEQQEQIINFPEVTYFQWDINIPKDEPEKTKSD